MSKLNKVRRCPECGKVFKEMTNNQWKFALFNHLHISMRHNFMDSNKANKIVEKEFKI